MSEPITPAISDRICQHMNEDHGDALVLYAKVYGNTPDAETARMLSIDPQGMTLSVDKAEKTLPVRILFDHTLESAEDAHHTLIEMVKGARKG
jgi:putative heme iron utilization protein